MIAASIALYVADKVLGPVVEHTWQTKIKAKLFPKDSYKSRLVQVIHQTVKEFEAIHPADKSSGKFPFYESKFLFEKLSCFILYKNGSLENVALDFKSNTNIIVPHTEQLDKFYLLFLDNVEKDKKLSALFADENYKEQIFANSAKLNGVIIGLISIKKDTTKIIEDTSEIKKILKEGNNENMPKELSTVLPKLSKDRIVGRTNDLKDLKKRLFGNKPVVLMNGMGGIGKTTLAMVYLTENYKEYDHILWVTSTTDNFVNDFISTPGLLESLNLDYRENPQNTYNLIILKLKSLSGKSLLIIDNSFAELSDYRNHLPGQPNWHLLVTSRVKIPFFEPKELGFLNEPESVELFKKHYTREKLEDNFLKELVKSIEYHTLTIEILAKTAQDLSMFPEELNTAILENMETDVVVRHSDKKIGKILSYLTLTFDLSKLPNDEIAVLKYISLLPSEFISYDMLEEALSFIEGNLKILLVRLAKKGWILYNDDEDTYKLHQIILEVVQSKYKYDDEFIIPLIESISNRLKVDYSKDNPISKFKWIPYGNELLNQFELRLISKIGTLQNNLAVVLRDLGDFKQAKILLEKAMISDEKNFGEEHPSTARTYSNLATVLHNLGDFSRAKYFCEKAYHIFLAKFGEDHPNTITVRDNLDILLKEMEKGN